MPFWVLSWQVMFSVLLCYFCYLIHDILNFISKHPWKANMCCLSSKVGDSKNGLNQKKPTLISCDCFVSFYQVDCGFLGRAPVFSQQLVQCLIHAEHNKWIVRINKYVKGLFSCVNWSRPLALHILQWFQRACLKFLCSLTILSFAAGLICPKYCCYFTRFKIL